MPILINKHISKIEKGFFPHHIFGIATFGVVPLFPKKKDSRNKLFPENLSLFSGKGIFRDIFFSEISDTTDQSVYYLSES